MKRKLLLLGATGLTGQQLLARAIEQGHDATYSRGMAIIGC